MSDQTMIWLSEARSYLPWISFIAGFGGSLHCVGMCGGLVTATCDKSGDVFRYQTGRLIGYLLVGLLAGYLGSLFQFKNQPAYLSIVPAVFIGGLFIYWGMKSLRGSKAELPAPKFVSHLYTRLWKKLVFNNKNFTKAFFTGLISIFLPCGLLYGVALGTISLQHKYEAINSMFFFWLGTLPSMIVAPVVVQRLIRPLKSKLPKTYALSLIAIGLVTITFRVTKLQEVGANSHLPGKEETRKSCH